jgi:hypothetical protein
MSPTDETLLFLASTSDTNQLESEINVIFQSNSCTGLSIDSVYISRNYASLNFCIFEVYLKHYCLFPGNLLSVGAMNPSKSISATFILCPMLTSNTRVQYIFLFITQRILTFYQYSFKHYERWASAVDFPRDNILNCGIR